MRFHVLCEDRFGDDEAEECSVPNERMIQWMTVIWTAALPDDNATPQPAASYMFLETMIRQPRAWFRGLPLYVVWIFVAFAPGQVDSVTSLAPDTTCGYRIDQVGSNSATQVSCKPERASWYSLRSKSSIRHNQCDSS